jgi:alkylation response protein AidB-like acyl-CoA dehydrogenase
MNQEITEKETLRTLPGDEVRQILWRFTDRFDLQMLVQSTRTVARGPVARAVAEGARNSHEWTDKKARLLPIFDEAGITSAFMEPEYGGYIEGPKNLALALIAYELSWVDAGSATCSMATNLALAPIHEKGTPEQVKEYMSRAVPPKPGENRRPFRGAFALTEPIPYVGVETGLLNGSMKIASWEDGQEPMLQVEKRGRFITNMGFANFVTAAVASADPRIKGSCVIILEETDPGTFHRGTPTKKLVHQLSSTRDPVFSLLVPASRIIGGYTVKDGVIIPNCNHGDVIEAVFKRTRVAVGLMTSAKLLSAVEPIIRYQRGRFRGGDTSQPGSPRYDLGLQQKEDSLHRLVDIWATGEASAALGFATARIFDELDPLEHYKEQFLVEQKIESTRAQIKAFGKFTKDALEYLAMLQQPEASRNAARFEELSSNKLIQFLLVDSVANVLCPATKLWNTGYGANMMREAVSLMGGYGITEDCPGFLGHKWMDAQLEATYEGPEAVQRRQLSLTMTHDLFLAQFRLWILEMRKIAVERSGTGACALASAMELWLWTLNHLQNAVDAHGNKLYHGNRQGVTFPLADALCWLLASRQQILDLGVLEQQGPQQPALTEALPGIVAFLTDICHVQTARAAGEVGRVCAELVYGYQQHPAWADKSTCKCAYGAEDLNCLEGIIPGISSGAPDGEVAPQEGEAKPFKAGPCVRFDGVEAFARQRIRLDACNTGARLAKDRAAESLVKVMIPEALDYPM